MSKLPPAPTPSPFGSLGSRFGTSKVNWEIIPISTTVVRFDVTGLGEPLYRLLATKKRRDVGDVEAAVAALDASEALLKQMGDRLDAAWTGYHLRGAALVYPWRDEVRACIVNRSNAEKHPVECLRACDPLLVFNVLVRARGHLLLANAPLALERAFLERPLLSDDPRLIALTQTTGYVKEVFKSDTPSG